MNNSSKRMIALLSLALVSYTAASILHQYLWADIAAPVFDFLAAGMVFQAIYSSQNKAYRINAIFCGIALFLWAVADTLWLIFTHVLHIDPGSSLLIALFYFGTNVFLLAAVVKYAFTHLRKWDSVQLVLDGITFSVAILWLIWAVLYHKDPTSLRRFLEYSVINSLTISMDIFLLIIIGIWYLSLRKGKLLSFLRILIASLVLYSLADLFYYHLYAHGYYLPDSYLDICYLATLFGVTFAIRMYYSKFPSTFTDADPSNNIGNSHRGLILILFPFLIATLETIDAFDIILYTILIVLHEFSSHYIQKAVGNQMLLSQEHVTNRQLEQLVSEQTKSLQTTNTELQKRNAELQYINDHDSLTGLYNRKYFFAALESYMQQCSSNDKIVLSLWNINKLKSINDTYGYATGDKLLIWHAAQVQKQFADGGILARLGSDEFAFAMKGYFLEDDLLPIATRVIDACRQPLTIGEYVFSIMVSVGISLFPTCAKDAVTLVKNAGIAMQHAKENPEYQHIVRYIDIDETIRRKYLIANRLATDDYDQVFSLHFQPQFRIADRKLVGMEALLRWKSPDLGSISPAEFIPIAEAANLIIPMGNWVIEHAVHQIADWNQLYETDLRMGINISPKQLDQTGTLDILRDTMVRYRVKFRWIDIEITESVALDNDDSADKIKRYFKNNDISISIDDFGTGYSSLGYLKILSFDRLKIAKPLIDKITFDDSSHKIVTSIILLAKSLGLQTISEGVETKEQFDLLLSLGCDQIQGFYLGEPLTAEMFEATFLKPQNDA